MPKKVLISSTGGHWAQLNEILLRTKDKDGIQLITEKNKSNAGRKDILFLKQQDRKSRKFPFIFLYNTFISLLYALKCRPKIVISTGAGATLPFLVFSKMMGSKIIFVESFAKIHSPTLTGKIVYRFADVYFVQWPEMLKIYPHAIYRGSLY
ncbi:PssD/Cps14F family polysaccharide biosynthesis glycosyltransferase [Sporolactobacillus sp. KGMB 08714]|uniref:PssD/Cps14F family polysaccharide biosynthesis glycosyltransferase n=1 Tax=Sporolactobacillus sp. KGMB 08714 TaxID=3064704 RepID=UPI002FBE16CD